MSDDLTPLTESKHWLGWLGDDPTQALREEIEHMLQRQVPTARLEWLRLTGEPAFLTGGRRRPDDETKIIVIRAALAVPFVLLVRSEGRADELQGVFSWVATGLDDERHDRAFLDLDAAMDWATDMLKTRMYAEE
ncbi:MAG: hypothetical protein MUD01_11400 [Chloroflexaceae bacterium]|jgi:hypothetical protein|nr:hypothetical protein [Chloroflexaceae bacterium]